MKKPPLFYQFTTIIFFSLLNLKSAVVSGESQSDMSFTENRGQVGDQYFKPRPDVLFTGSAGNTTFHLRTAGISYQIGRVDEWREREDKFMKIIKEPVRATLYRLDVNWRNANANARLVAENALPGYSNYYVPVAPEGITQVKSYRDITYKMIYPGIDLHYYGKDQNLKYDFIVAPGADH